MLEPGQELFERYRVERMVARGGMATVYLVRHLSLNSQHALKVLDLSTADIRARLLQEGRIQASLTHPHIVAVTDAVELDGQPALIMEYVDGPTLADVLENRAPDLPEALEWFRQILGAVRYAHDRGLVHRDLKPENILMAQYPDGLHPKVADFGIAKVLTDWMAERPGPKTRAGVGMGTPAYMPPEQINSAAGVDHRADVFALGCILYELVCGRRAFAGENLVSVLSAVMTGRYPPPGDLVSGLPPGVIAAIEGALQPDPEARTPNCQAMAALLDAGVPHPLAAPAVAPLKRQPTPVPVSEPPRRGFSKVLLVGLISLVLLIGLGVVGLLGVLSAGGLGFVVARTAQVPSPPQVALSSERPDAPDAPDAPDEPDAPEPSVAPEVGPRVPQVAPSTARSTRVEVASWRRSQGVRNGVMRREAIPGHSLILVQTTLTNLSDEEVDLMFPWKVVDGNEGSWGSDLKCSMSLKGSMDALANLEPREVRSGELCFEVPDAATGLMLQFTDGLGSDAELRFPL